MIDEAFGFSCASAKNASNVGPASKRSCNECWSYPVSHSIHLVQFGLGTSFALDLRHVVGIDVGDAGREDPVHLSEARPTSRRLEHSGVRRQTETSFTCPQNPGRLASLTQSPDAGLW